MNSRQLIDIARRNGYKCVLPLPTGQVGALVPNLFTTGLIIMGEFGPSHRWCYENYDEAKMALAKWDGFGDPPGNWIKQKLPVERLNPNWARKA